MSLIKICGLTQISDAKYALEKGVSYLGLIFVDKSPRFVSKAIAKQITEALPEFDGFVGVFSNQSKKDIETFCSGLNIKIIQLHGNETPAFCNYFINRGFQIVKVFRVDQSIDQNEIQKYDNCHYFLFDTYQINQQGGTGQTFNWQLLSNSPFLKKSFISGGITPENVVKVIEALNPYAIDCSSGVELTPGKKDVSKIDSLVQRTRSV